MNTAFFRLVEKAASGRYLHSNDTPPCPPRPPLYAPQDVVSERTLKVMLVFGRRLYFILLYVELTISFLIGRKRTVNFRNQRLWRHPDADYTIIMLRTLKVKGKSCQLPRFVLLVFSEKAKTWLPFFRSFYNKSIIRFGFCDTQNSKRLGKGYQPGSAFDFG